MLPYYSHTAPVRESQLLKQEYDPQFCRESYTLKAGSGAARIVLLGTPLATVIAAANVAVAAAAAAGGTGNGTLTLADPAFTSSVKEGRYIVTCSTGGADGTSKFRVEGPDGKAVGTATGGTAFAKEVKFTIAGGGTDFAEGDTFMIDVAIDQAADTNERVAWVPGAADDTGIITGLSLRDTTAADGVSAEGLSLDRGPAIVSVTAIAWPDGISAANKAIGIEMLKKLGIIQR
ncbi:head decoration protein [Hoeflea sp. BAL378]|uniref:head decoration protein n=1 Tax=Hoeflea sp. BAL378 TaxID=1547437 RepID=UPI000689C393|nr:head decoration protein [Hoeflea sp. BAL378]